MEAAGISSFGEARSERILCGYHRRSKSMTDVRNDEANFEIDDAMTAKLSGSGGAEGRAAEALASA